MLYHDLLDIYCKSVNSQTDMMKANTSIITYASCKTDNWSYFYLTLPNYVIGKMC